MALRFLFWALLLLTLPLNWLLAAVVAAVWHEGCHYLALRLLRGRARGLRLGATGAVMDVWGLSRGGEMVCALAGPLGGLVLTLLWPHWPRLAFCAAVQSGFNLLPVYPLDGGRALGCLLPDALCRVAEGITLAVILGLCFRFRLWFVIVWMTLSLLARKSPCKAPFLKVQ